MKIRHLGWDVEALVALAIVWVASFLQCVGTLVREEDFGGETSLAFVALIAASYLIGKEVHDVTHHHRGALGR